MRSLGKVFRYILNINTIWGLMVLISFFMCLYQDRKPERAVLSSGLFKDSGNVISIKMTDIEDKEHSVEVPVESSGGVLAVPETTAGKEDFEWSFALEPRDGGQLLTWNYKQDGTPVAGDYDLLVNGHKVEGADGKRVTLKTMTDAAFDYAKSGFTLAFNLVPAMILFLGLMKVGEEAGIVQMVARLIYPIIRFLFPQVPKDHPASGAILMNITTSIVGIGNAATPFGLKAMKELQDLNPHKNIASDSQIMLLAYNTAGFAILPTTLIAMRKSAGASDPLSIVLACMIAGLVSTTVAIVMVKLLAKLRIFSLEAAVAEEIADETRAAAKDTHVHAKSDSTHADEEEKKS